MKVLVGLALGALAVVGAGGYLARAKLGRLPAKMEALMESCPPIQAMRRLEEQNDKVIDLLHDQNALLRRDNAGAPAVVEV